MTQYIIKQNDIPTLMDCMTECFAETDKVSAKMLAAKMVRKTGRPFTYQNISYLYTLLGFVATPVENTAERFKQRGAGRNSCRLGFKQRGAGRYSCRLGFKQRGAGRYSCRLGFKQMGAGRNSCRLGFKQWGAGRNSCRLGFKQRGAGRYPCS